MESVPSPKTVADFPEPQVFNPREARDIDAFEWLIPHEAKVHKFSSKREAYNFMVACVGKAPERLGVKIPTFIPTQFMREYLVNNDIAVVPKKFPLKNDYWRNGWYFYHNKELKLFVSFPMKYLGKMELGGRIKIADQEEYHVRSNVNP